MMSKIMFITLIMWSCVTLATPMHSDSTATDSMLSPYDVGEVVIKAKGVRHYADHDTWNVTDLMRKGAFTTNMMLTRISGMRYNSMTGGLEYMGKTNILLLMDGKEKEPGYIGNLANIRFKKVEIYPNPRGRYQNYDVVVNLISYEGYEGVESLLQGKAVLLPSTHYDDFVSQENPEGTVTYTRGGWNVATHYQFVHNNTQRSHEMLREEPGDIRIETVSRGVPTYADINNQHSAWIDADYDINKCNSLSAKYSFSHFSKNGHTNYMTQRAMRGTSLNSVSEQAWNRAASTEHIASLFYRGQWGEHWNAYIDATADFYSADNGYTYFENRSCISSALTDNSQHFYRINTDFTYQAGHITWNFGTIGISVKNNYRTSGVDAHGHETRYRGYTTFTRDFSHLFTASLGCNVEHTSTDSDDAKQTLFSVHGNASKRFGEDYVLRLNYRGLMTRPSQWQLNPTGIFQDSVLYICGNPDLKANISHTVNLNAILNGLTINADYKWSDNAVDKIHTWTGEYIIMRDANIKRREMAIRISKLFNISLPHDKMLLLYANLGYSYSYASANPWSNHKHTFIGDAYVWWVSNKFPNNIKLSYSRESRIYIQPQGYDTGGEDGWQLSTSHTFSGGTLYISANWLLPLDWGVRRRLEYALNAPNYKKTSSQDWFSHNQNRITVSILYRFAAGRQVSKKNNIQSVEDKGTWGIQ